MGAEKSSALPSNPSVVAWVTSEANNPKTSNVESDLRETHLPGHQFARRLAQDLNNSKVLVSFQIANRSRLSGSISIIPHRKLWRRSSQPFNQRPRTSTRNGRTPHELANQQIPDVAQYAPCRAYHEVPDPLIDSTWLQMTRHTRCAAVHRNYLSELGDIAESGKCRDFQMRAIFANGVVPSRHMDRIRYPNLLSTCHIERAFWETYAEAVHFV